MKFVTMGEPLMRAVAGAASYAGGRSSGLRRETIRLAASCEETGGVLTVAAVRGDDDSTYAAEIPLGAGSASGEVVMQPERLLSILKEADGREVGVTHRKNGVLALDWAGAEFNLQSVDEEWAAGVDDDFGEVSGCFDGGAVQAVAAFLDSAGGPVRATGTTFSRCVMLTVFPTGRVLFDATDGVSLGTLESHARGWSGLPRKVCVYRSAFKRAAAVLPGDDAVEIAVRDNSGGLAESILLQGCGVTVRLKAVEVEPPDVRKVAVADSTYAGEGFCIVRGEAGRLASAARRALVAGDADCRVVRLSLDDKGGGAGVLRLESGSAATKAIARTDVPVSVLNAGRDGEWYDARRLADPLSALPEEEFVTLAFGPAAPGQRMRPLSGWCGGREFRVMSTEIRPPA